MLNAHAIVRKWQHAFNAHARQTHSRPWWTHTDSLDWVRDQINGDTTWDSDDLPASDELVNQVHRMLWQYFAPKTTTLVMDAITEIVEDQYAFHMATP